MSCTHEDFRCLGYYVPIRSYMCTKCGEVFICDCEKEIATYLLPTQMRSATEFGTGVKYPIKGFLPNLCETCKGRPESPRQRRYGNKIERYYWREIDKTYYHSILDWLKENDLPFETKWDFEKNHPKISNALIKKAKNYWKEIHENNPKYDMGEPSQAFYIENIPVPIGEISMESTKKKHGKKNITQWIVDSTPYVTIESAVSRYYELMGYTAWFCQMKLIASLVGIFGILAKNYDPGRARDIPRF